MNINKKNDNLILAIVITYYPEKELLYRNISAFIDYVDKILIWENTPRRDSESYRYINDEKVEYCGDGVNSISRALNFAWHYAKDNGYDYLLTMDQDSQWGENFKQYLNQTVFNSNAPEGIWGPMINKINKTTSFIEFDYVITSGMLIPVKLINMIGGWNEHFPVDSVDVEFCFRAWRKGVPVYKVCNCSLTQRYGMPQQAVLFGHEVFLRNDSPQRLYNIYKNFVIMTRKYPERKYFRKEVLCKMWIGRIKWILFFEKNRWAKAKAISCGIVSGLFYDLKKI